METIVTPIVILGGGPSGLAAASMAARMGQKVLISERESSFGGQWMQIEAESMKGSASCLSVTELKKAALLQQGREVISDKTYKSWIHSILEKQEVDCLIHSSLASIKLKNGTISRMEFVTDRGIVNIKPTVVIDASGVGSCAAMAGVQMFPEESESNRMAPVLHFYLDHVDTDRFQKEGTVHFCLDSELFSEVEVGLAFSGKVHVVLTRKDLKNRSFSVLEYSAFQISAEKDAEYALNLIRKTIPGLEAAVISSIPAGYIFPEGPHPIGNHVYSEDEMENGTVFKDWAVGRILPRNMETDSICTLPYGSFTTREIRNLLLAGRCLSMESGAYRKLRGLPFSLATGNAAGCAAVLSLAQNGRVKKIDTDLLQQTLFDLGMARPEETGLITE